MADTHRRAIQKFPESKNFYIYKRKRPTYDYTCRVFDIATNKQTQIISLTAFNKCLSILGNAMLESRQLLVKFIRYIEKKLETEKKNDPNATLVKLTHAEWKSICIENYKHHVKVQDQLRTNPAWLHRHFYVTMLFSMSPTNEHMFNFDFPLCPDEYKMKIPMGQVMVIRMLLSIQSISLRINSLKKFELNSWKMWEEIFMVTLIAPRIIKQLRDIIKATIVRLKKN